MKSGSPKIFILTVLLIGAAAGFGWIIFAHFQDQTGSSKSGKTCSDSAWADCVAAHIQW
jgi:hypothetical protein